MKYSRYKHELDYSYAQGGSVVYELLCERPDDVIEVVYSPDAKSGDGFEKLKDLCAKKGVPFSENRKLIDIISNKGNCFYLGIFRKWKDVIGTGSHIVLVNPSDAGNVGTILRTACGFGFRDVAIVRPAVDFFDPKCIRAGMGAHFHERVESFDSFEEYLSRFKERTLYAFELGGKMALSDIKKTKEPYSLIFGNESRGLDPEVTAECDGVIIKHNSLIDSLSLPTAAAMAIYHFSNITGTEEK